ncbi:MAG: efflux RND transporter periplasmic adaptor subunit [Gammaproteobacteria bacterium]
MTRLLFFLFAAFCISTTFAQKPETKTDADNKASHQPKNQQGTEPQRKGPPPAIVIVEKAVQESIAPTALYSATVISRDDANLSAELAGRITWVAEVGDRIQTGDPVVKLDDIFIKQQVIEEKSIIQSERAKFDLHSKEVKRFTELLEQNNVARSQLDQAISDQAVARSNMASANARLAQANERLRRTNIVAPFNGVVSERLLQTGEWANNGTTIIRLVSVSNLEIQTHIPADSLRFVTIGASLNYLHGTNNGVGKVRALVPIGGDTSRLYELRISAEDESLIAGKLLRIAIPTEHEREAILVPRDALVLRREGVYVFRVNENSMAERIQVETGIADLNRIEVVGGIQVDDQVITRGGENLRPGMTVTVKSLEVDS